MRRKKSTAFRTAIMGVTAIATSLTIGLTAACTKTTEPDDDEKTTTKIDSQTIKNGDFEFYSDNDGLYPISSPDSWTGATNGSSSASMSGIINTNKERWDYITDTELPKILEDNDDLKSDDENKKDYRGALTDDLPFKNPHDATKTNATAEEMEYIANPFTHNFSYDADGTITDGEGNTYTETFKNEDDGKLYLDADFTKPYDTSVLMIHNYRSGYYTGTESYFDSSTTITLESGTACEISLWVKTDELYYDGAQNERTPVEWERGAYIKVNTQVGGNTLDSFEIKNINTQKLNPKPEEGEWENNGWVQFTVYVEASRFADTTVNLTLGLGENDIYTVEGYAFFDDITFTKYLNLAELEENCAEFGETISDDNTSRPLEPNAKTEFRVDEVSYKTNDPDSGELVDKVNIYNSEDRHFFIDFASSIDASTIALSQGNIEAGFTVDETNTGNYTCSNASITNVGWSGGTINNESLNAFIPTKLPKDGIDITDDLIGTTKVTTADDWDLGLTSSYNNLLTDALKSAAKLPGVADGSTDAMYILSTMGAAYQTEINDASFTVADGEYKLITFWIKTSDMGGSTAATIKAVDKSDKDTASTAFTVDSTTETLTTIGDVENVYNGWVRCFVRVENTSKDSEDKQFKLVINFGNTTIKGTTSSSYKAGWLAIANMSVMELDKDVYGYTSSMSHSTTLSFTETVKNTNNAFDTEQGDKNVIKNDLATPSSYTGVNGASINVKPTGNSATEYDKTNANPYAGLLNKDNVENYIDKDWFNALSALAKINNEIDNGNAIWEKVFGKYTVQPILIVNKARELGEESEKIYNYGYIASANSTISASGYTAVSVRVLASAGAIANVYLIDADSNDNSVMTYDLPKYNFWYDDNGNILKGEPKDDATADEKKANIAYTLREDGLYESTDINDKNLYANFYNLSKYYDLRYEHSSFYDGNGKLVSYENLVQGETYYANPEKTAYAPHHLVASNNGNNKVYEYNSGVDGETTYYYMENQEANTSKVVHGIDTTKALMRYDYTEAVNTPYQFTIDTLANTDYANRWITVTFYIHAGSTAKNYRLELWSGYRDEQSNYVATTQESIVAFDYSSISLDQSTFEGLRDAYVNEIVTDYREMISDELEDNNANIAELEGIAPLKSNLYNYEANYYTFSLYDSEAFIPFNGETAEDNKSGYSFEYSEYEETLAFLKVDDLNDQDNMRLSMFIDYSAVDKDIDIIGEPTPPAGDDGTSSTDTNPTNVWLLAASIILVGAIIVAMGALLIRYLVKTFSRKRTAGKNTYNFNKNKRYVKKYVKANGEAPVIPEGEVDESLLSDKPEEAPATEEPSTATDEAQSTTAEEASEPAADEAQSTTTDEVKADGDKNESEESSSESKPDGDSEN